MRTVLTRITTLVAAIALFVASAGPAMASGQRFVQISVGYQHACGLTTGGAAYCWGKNDVGQLGDGTTNNSGVNGPQPVIGDLRFVSIQSGDEHNCGLTSRGAAYCWGYNVEGQLGDGTTNDSGVNGPQPVIGGLRFASLSIGGGFASCGLTSRGAAYCWGANNNGELGDGTMNDSGVNGPQPVIGGHRFKSMAPGEGHTCGLTSRGAAFCWGDNDYGQLGDGTVTDSDNNGPQSVIGGLKFTSLNAGFYSTCGLTSLGAAYCWGINNNGALGDGTTTDSRANGPQAVIGGLRFKSILAGEGHTCGLTSRGAAFCWGMNDRGQLGDGTTTDSRANGPQAVIGGLRFARISAGYELTCGLTARGDAYCWGANNFGQLGDGTRNDSGVNGPQAVQ